MGGLGLGLDLVLVLLYHLNVVLDPVVLADPRLERQGLCAQADEHVHRQVGDQGHVDYTQQT